MGTGRTIGPAGNLVRRDWLQIIGVVLALTSALATASMYIFYTRSSGDVLEEKLKGHIKAADDLHSLQADFNKELKQQNKEMKQELRQVSDNVLILGERFRVRGRMRANGDDNE